MFRRNLDGTKIQLTIPNHPRFKSSTLSKICTLSNISPDAFVDAYNKA
jgi:hypothetical protein